MPYIERNLNSFGGGLNIRDKEDAILESQAIDLLNVVFTDRGAVRQRDGFTALTAALTNPAATLHEYYTTSGTAQIIAGCGTRLEAITTAGAVAGSATPLTSGTWGFARFGTPGNEVIYAGQGATTLNKWSGVAPWTTAIASTPAAGSLCVMPTSN